jgi:hypothetical protein
LYRKKIRAKKKVARGEKIMEIIAITTADIKHGT